MRTTRTCTVRESLTHISCAIAVVVIVYLIAGLIGDGAVAATRYFSG
ncbi:hypothetical protein ACFSC3_04185 [Sphingomonas floccifaciens]|uniref:Uncharacterized protein n=1 Tax=Sphingomonas floccifaciens TaxID=1844115 RepID=A0ABW4N9K0_9SPHN